jgi:tetratricopeptide (TPR) repeat protein
MMMLTLKNLWQASEMSSLSVTGEQEMIKALKRILICLISALLFACAGGEVKDRTELISEGKPNYYVDVDSDVESDFNNAIILMQGGNNAQAVAVLLTVIEREQRLPAPYVNLAIAYNRMGDTKAAEENLISALKLDIGHPVANNELGLLYRRSGKFNAARQAYENAIKQHPDYMPAIRNLGVLCDLYLHDFNCALQQYEDYMELNPDDKTVAVWIADVQNRLGK